MGQGLPERRLLPKGEWEDLRHLVGSQIRYSEGTRQKLGGHRELWEHSVLVLVAPSSPCCSLLHSAVWLAGVGWGGLEWGAHLVVGHVEMLQLAEGLKGLVGQAWERSGN